MPQTASELELKSKIASVLKCQHYLGGVPGAQRVIPLAAFAVGDILAQNYKTNNKIEDLLCEPQSNIVQLPAPPPAAVIQYHTKHFPRPGSVTIVDSCLTCSRMSIPDGSPTKIKSDAFQCMPQMNIAGTSQTDPRSRMLPETFKRS